MGVISNYIFILIPLAIFIGRIIIQARNKRKAPQRRPVPQPQRPPRIPVSFEDDAEYNAKPFKPVPAPSPAALIAAKDTVYGSIPELNRTPPKMPEVKARNASQSEQGDFFTYLKHLSPLKQAVVMAEVLGPPKGIF